MLRKESIKVILTGFAFSFTLELLQYVIGIGATDITDLLGNVCGTATGVGIYGALCALFKNKERLDRIISIVALACTILFGGLIAVLLLAN